MDRLELEKYYLGNSFEGYKIYGAHITKENNVNGVRFTVYAPNAAHIQIIGEFNLWDGSNYEMNRVDSEGTYSIFVENVTKGMMYKYRIFQKDGRTVDRADPYAFYSELRPGTASIVASLDNSIFNDGNWIKKRNINYNKPLNIYEMHFGSWRQKEGKNVQDRWIKYNELSDSLIPYLKENNFTHVEILPLLEHPFDGSWGYQVSGFFSVTSRYGSIQELMYFINECHKNNIGVILDFVLVHFVVNDYALAKFDGTPLYEYEFEEVSNSSWGTKNFDFFSKAARSFLLSSVNYWLDVFHIDGIRIDAINNALYWQGNSTRGINVGAVDLLKTLNSEISKRYKGVMMIAEDSSCYPKVTAPIKEGGLGFHYKWDLGWMNDTLKYYSMHPYDRKNYHNMINFSMMYFYSEKFLIEFSHDEVVHGKKTIIDKLYGSYEEKFAQGRTLYLYMVTHPGKKLNFMGNELAHFREWDEERELDWLLLDYPMHKAFHNYWIDIFKIYKTHKALYEDDYSVNGFKWLDADDNEHCVFTYERISNDEKLIIAINNSNNYYEDYIIGVNSKYTIKEIINSDNSIYGGENNVNSKEISAVAKPYKGFKYSFKIKLAPFASCIFKVLNN
ncbi:MAG: 1,4-alpha-glucan branching protein GlgB [Clostridiales bacterium]|nr:1,4-alpha-glucan branching protein GlgB [Clostridiales bacterium]